MLHVLVLMTTLVLAQASELPKGHFPEGWKVRLDGAAAPAAPSPAQGGAAKAAPSAKDISFVVMAPGWHITSGPSAIYYQPTQTASGAYSLQSETFLFDPGTRREAFGVFLGGRNLESDQQAYTYFVIRRTGEFLIRRRTGATTADVMPWTANAAIKKWEDRAADAKSVRNVLAVKVAPDTTAFLVNGSEVARLPTTKIDTEGIVGLRVNHQLNIHVTSLDVVK